MKRAYTKPMVIAENFTLSSSIAACSIKIGFLDNACVVRDPDTPPEMRSFALMQPVYFSHVCEIDSANIQLNDSLCIHTQTAATFTS